jgi:hypothetical protein
MNDKNLENNTLVHQKLADKLSISIDELELLTWDIGEVNSQDGMVYDCTMIFGEDSPREILRKIAGLSEQNTRNISLNIMDLNNLGKD